MFFDFTYSVGSHLNYVFTSPQTVANSLQMKSVKICRFKTSVVEIFAWRTLFPFRYFSIDVKMCVLLTYSAIKWV